MKKKILFPLIGVPQLGLGLLLTSCEPQVRYADVVDDRVHLAVLTGEGFHDGEAYMPMGFLVNQGARITVIGPEVGTVTAYNIDFSIYVEKAVADVSVDDFDGLKGNNPQAHISLRNIKTNDVEPCHKTVNAI